MQQYFMDTKVQLQQSFLFSKEQGHHIKNVLRMKEKEVVKVVDSMGNPFYAQIMYEGKEVQGYCVEALERKENKVKITLIQGMIKKDKWDFLLQKVCELGVDQIIPMISSRTIVKVEKDDHKKLERYNKIALEACEQCKRDSIVQVEAPIAFKECVAHKKQLSIVAYEEADFASAKLKDLLQQHQDINEIVYVIGSEGGFSKEEIAYLEEHGFIRASLGERILRAETAAISVVNTTMYEYE